MRAACFSAFASAHKRRNQRPGCCKHAHAHTHGFTISSIDNTSTCPHIIVIIIMPVSHILSRKSMEKHLDTQRGVAGLRAATQRRH